MSAVPVGEWFVIEQQRIRRILDTYRRLDGQPWVDVKAAIENLEGVLMRSEQAASSGDAVKILRSFDELRGRKPQGASL